MYAVLIAGRTNNSVNDDVENPITKKQQDSSPNLSKYTLTVQAVEKKCVALRDRTF